MALLSRNGHEKEIDPNSIGENKGRCLRLAKIMAKYMDEEVTVYKSKSSNKFYFRLSGDSRRRIKRDSVVWESIV